MRFTWSHASYSSCAVRLARRTRFICTVNIRSPGSYGTRGTQQSQELLLCKLTTILSLLAHQASGGSLKELEIAVATVMHIGIMIPIGRLRDLRVLTLNAIHMRIDGEVIDSSISVSYQQSCLLSQKMLYRQEVMPRQGICKFHSTSSSTEVGLQANMRS